MALRTKTPRKIYSFGISQYKTTSWNIGFDLDSHESWLERYRRYRGVVEEQIFQSLTKDLVHKDTYINPKLKRYERVKYQQHFMTSMCHMVGVLRMASVYKQGNNCYSHTAFG